ncbi:MULTISPECIES: ABC transporter permease [Bacillus cereus group]|uniref:ABC transporter permease n=1 Tax=Bacillus cereus group TaxID=86661 RepID=UPI0021D19B0E|nr:ABC transporter permease [Bacillus wiedmannii]MCU5600861.1 ABC transporter permease [Bacillus wiedmannii]
MNFIKRAFLSMKQRKGTTFILMAIFLIVVNLVLAGFTVQNATQKAADNARKKLGAEVDLGPDVMKLLDNGQEDKFTPLTDRLADKLAKSKYVKHYNYLFTSDGTPDGFKHIEPAKPKENRPSSTMIGGGGDLPTLNINGVREMSLLDTFKSGESKMVDGKPITKDVVDKDVAVIEKRLATENNLKVGDKIKVKGRDAKTTVEYEIIGIYETSQKVEGFLAGLAMLEPANNIYTTYKAAQKNAGEKSEKAIAGTPDATSLQALYSLKDPLYVDAFKEEAKKSGLDFEVFKLDAHDELYKQMIGPIKNIASTSQMIIYIVSIAGAIILGLIIMLSIKGRRKEMGILLSIGEKKWKLMAQLVVEVACVAVLAFGLSVTTGSKVSQLIGDNLLSSEIATASEEKDGSQNNSVMVGMDGKMQNEKEDPIDKIDVSVTGEDLGKMGGIGLAIAILATLIPALSILRLNPKQILLKDE